MDELYYDTPEDILVDGDADELEDAENSVIEDDGTDIDTIADITDDDVENTELDDEDLDDGYDDVDHIDYEVDVDDADCLDDIENTIINDVEDEEEI